ncbi:MAG: DUF2236 domain-containing protein [Crocinitomix sp.]|nr:DUF2236 domain-containing protein [Crocinitomix sp.]
MSSSNYTNEQLEAFRSKSDPLADHVVDKIMANGSGRSISELFDKMIKNSDFNEADLPVEVAEYFKNTEALPTWADQNKIKVGQDVFAQFGPEICLLLMCKSLPEAYACKKGAEVLHQTGRLSEGTDGALERFKRRLMETSQFVVNICTPGGYEVDGSGIITAQKVRLIHAVIRHYIVAHGNWNAELNGLPINQEDMAGTLQSFSSLVIEGLTQCGVTLTAEQIDGYYHCWRVAGHIVGLDEALNPPTYAEGLKLGYAILNQQKEGSQAGVELTNALTDFIKEILPGNIFNDTPAILIRYFVGESTGDMLGIKEEKGVLSKVMPRLLRTVFREEENLENNSHIYHKIASKVSLAMLQGMLNHFNEYKGVHFYIPPGLQENWKLETSWDHFKTLSPAVAGYRLAIEKKKSSL